MKRWILMIAGAACLVAGCESPLLTQAQAVRLVDGDVRNGQTTREQVLLKYGTPAAEFEQGRILTFRLEQHDDGTLIPCTRDLEPSGPANTDRAAWLHTAYSLVLVFDERGLVKQHSLVPMRRTAARH